MIFTLEGLSDFLKFASVAGDDDNDPLLLAAKVMLYKNNVNPTKNTVVGDLEECTITGYARSAAVTWALPVLSNEVQLPTIFGDLKTFTMTTQSDPAQTLFGYALVATISAVDHLIAVAPFPESIEPADGSVLGIVPRVCFSEIAMNPTGDVAID